MKKAIFAAAVAASFAGMAVESATVGYDRFNLNYGQKILKAMNFQTADGENISITDLVPYDGSDVSDGNFTIWWWKPGVGNQRAVWNGYYYDPTDPEADPEDGCVWLDDPEDYVWTTDDDDAPIKWEKSFSNGEGFFMQPSATTPNMTISGKVPGSENTQDAYRSMALTYGQKRLISNPFPSELDITTLVPLDGDSVSDGNFTIWWWKPGVGNQRAVWNGYYYDPTDPEADPEDGCVWLDDPEDYVWTTDDDDAPIKWEKIFERGEGFFVQPSATTPILMFPNPFKK